MRTARLADATDNAMATKLTVQRNQRNQTKSAVNIFRDFHAL